MSSRVYWIWLSLSCTPSYKSFPELILKFGDAKGIYDADADDIASAVGSKSRDYLRLCDKDLEKAEMIDRFCSSKNVGIVTYGDAEYPNSLRDISSPPVLLY